LAKAYGDVGLEAAGQGLVAVEGAVDVAHDAGDRLDLRPVKDAVAQQDDRAARLVDEGVGSVMGVGGVETHEHAFAFQSARPSPLVSRTNQRSGRLHHEGCRP
jgi:hypothetical protein